MSRRTLLFVLFALALATACVRLGMWQLDRLGQRRLRNELVAARLAAPTTPLAEMTRDTAAARYRRATVSGTYDYPYEFVLSSQSRTGSPGVNVITPLTPPGTDTAVLVNRGWVYSPDGMRVDFGRWRETDTATVTGYLVPLTAGGRGGVTTSSSARAVRRLDRDTVGARLPYPIAPYVLVALGDRPPARDSVPVRLAAPLLDEGPHLGYAFQWFAFAAIAVIGAAVTVRAERSPARRARVRTAGPERAG